MRISEQTLKLFEVYAAHCCNTSTDAGWHRASVIQLLIDFRGQLPRSSGGMLFDSLVREVCYLRQPHYLLPQALDAFYYWWRDKALTCLIYNCVYRGRIRDYDQGRTMRYREEDIVEQVNRHSVFVVSLSTFKRKVAEADERVVCGLLRAA